METISLTLFTDYLLAHGRQRATVVRAHHREPYDVYAFCKEGLVAVATGRLALPELRARCSRLDARRAALYPPLLDGFARFLGSREVRDVGFFAPGVVYRGIAPGYALSANPEIGFVRPGEPPTVVKLWVRREPLTRKRAELTCGVLEVAHQEAVPGARAAVLDVRAGKLVVPGAKALADARLVVEAEAAAYTALFKKTEREVHAA